MDDLRDALRADAAGVARALLGEPNAAASNKRALRWGSKGSMSVEITGSKKGFWFSHEGGEGSDLLGLIRHVKGWRFPDAIEWASRHTGIVPDDNDDWVPPAAHQQGPSSAEADAARAAEAAEAEADEASRVAVACKVAAGCIPLGGTLGEVYLKQTRGIPAPVTGWPASIQFHPVHRALVAIATASDGTVRAVQRVHLGEHAGKVSEDEKAARRLPAVKVTNGVTIGAVVRLPGDAAGPLLIAEGPETGLSVYTATGHETWLSLGSVSKVQPPIGRKVVIISDDNPAVHDARYGQAAKALRKALQVWRKAGVDLVVATPWQVRRKDRSDFADVILQHGVDAVRRRLEEALQPARAETKRLAVKQAQEAVGAAVGGFFDLVDAVSIGKAEWDKKARSAMDDTAAPFDMTRKIQVRTPEEERNLWEEALSAPVEEQEPIIFVHGVRCDVGTGKSHAARARIAETLINMRARGDNRAIVLALPMHALSDEQAERFRQLPEVKEAGLRVEVWRGRGAPDPTHPDYQHVDQATAKAATMCQKLDVVHEAQSVGLSAQTSCCKRRVEVDGKRVTLKCPLFDTCSYQAQSRRSADLWIMASDLLWHTKPAAMGEVAAVVVDEGAWRKGLQGAEGRHLTLSLDEIGDDVKIPFGLMSEPRLRDLRRQLLEALRRMPDGPIQRKAMQVDTQLTDDSASEAFKLEWSRKVDTLHPGLSKEERRAELEGAEGNRTIARFAMLWNAVRALLSANGPDASGWVSLDREQTKNGAVRVVHLKGRKDIASDWKVPTLLLDALLPVDLVRPFWPDIELVADVKAVAKHQHVYQVVDRAFALSMLAPLDEEAAIADPEEAQRRTNRL
ncbi:MAG: toprim domain-containing protein, partial [Janthinobacterium lividum]